MYYITITRNEFMGLFVQGKPIQSNSFGYSEYEKPRHGELGLCWRDEQDFHDPKNAPLPIYIIVNDDELLDFLAWVSSHFQTLNPITPYHRVLPHSLFAELLKEPIKKVPESVWDALIGLTLGETYSMGMGSDSNFIPSAFNTSTSFSFILGRCVAEGFSPKVWADVFDNWTALRSFFGLSKTIMDRERFYICSCILLFILDRESECFSRLDMNFRYDSNFTKNKFDNYIYSSEKNKNFIYDIESLLKYGFDTQDSLLKFANSFDIPIDTYDFFSLPKEERYSSMKNILANIDIKNFVDEFIYAYLVNLISPGSFSHTDLFTGKCRAALPWYGLCAGLSSHSKIKQAFNSLGKRIYRDMTRKENFFSVPKCDIAVNEILSLYREKEELFDVISGQRITVELAPNVEIVMSRTVRQEPDMSKENKFELISDFLEFLSDESSHLLQVLNDKQPLSTIKKRRSKKR